MTKPHYPKLKRSLGQNFLKDANIAARIVAALTISTDDSVLEIGPGAGALSKYILAAQPQKYTAIEKDTHWAAELAQKTTAWAKDQKHIQIHTQDALTVVWEEWHEPLKIIGNLPYNIASPLMWDICSKTPNLQKAVFMIQKEVGERIIAKPNTKAYGALSVWLQNFVLPKLEFIVPPHVFVPAPKVDSAVLSFTPHATAQQITRDEKENLSRLIHVCFQQRRKQLQKILRTAYGAEAINCLHALNIAEKARPEDLNPEQFRTLAHQLAINFQ